jgi:hypothetical protein
MANDLFGGLGSLGGLGDVLGDIAKSVVPKDTPEGKLLAAGSEVGDLQKQESELLLEIGKAAYQQNPSAWPQDSKLKLIRQNLDTAQATLSEAKQAQEAAEATRASEDAKGRCPQCGHNNPADVKFCQDCGSPLASMAPKHCSSCDAELPPGTRFCGECGAQQDG